MQWTLPQLTRRFKFGLGPPPGDWPSLAEPASAPLELPPAGLEHAALPPPAGRLDRGGIGVPPMGPSNAGSADIGGTPMPLEAGVGDGLDGHPP